MSFPRPRPFTGSAPPPRPRVLASPKVQPTHNTPFDREQRRQAARTAASRMRQFVITGEYTDTHEFSDDLALIERELGISYTAG